MKNTMNLKIVCYMLGSVKYLGVILFSDMKTSIDVSRQTSKFYAHTKTLLRNFCYCSDEVKCMLFRSFCTTM